MICKLLKLSILCKSIKLIVVHGLEERRAEKRIEIYIQNIKIPNTMIFKEKKIIFVLE